MDLGYQWGAIGGHLHTHEERIHMRGVVEVLMVLKVVHWVQEGNQDLYRVEVP
jgi:hypothetical protein